MVIKELKIILTITFMIMFLILNLFVLSISGKYKLLLIIGIFFLIMLFFTKFKKDNFFEEKSLITTTIIFGIIQIAMYYMTGLFEGFQINAVMINKSNFLNLILPFMLAITVTELLRYLLSTYYKDSKVIKWLSYFLMVLIDISLYNFHPDLQHLTPALEFFGLTLFPSLIMNAIFNNLVVDYGYKPILAYRITTNIVYYLFPIIPATYTLFRTLGKMIFPIILYFVISFLYEKIEFKEIFTVNEKMNIFFIMIILVLLFFCCLISCKFKYGALAVGSGSMTGTIDLGDVVVFEEYKKQELKENDIIIFKQDNKIMVHRIVEINRINGENTYITKGDYNKNRDNWYVYPQNIKGIAMFKIKYIGYPTILIRKYFA